MSIKKVTSKKCIDWGGKDFQKIFEDFERFYPINYGFRTGMYTNKRDFIHFDNPPPIAPPIDDCL